MINMRVIKAKTAIMTVVIIVFLLISVIKVISFYSNSLKEVSLTSCIEETILSTKGNVLKQASGIDRDSSEKILSS